MTNFLHVLFLDPEKEDHLDHWTKKHSSKQQRLLRLKFWKNLVEKWVLTIKPDHCWVIPDTC